MTSLALPIPRWTPFHLLSFPCCCERQESSSGSSQGSSSGGGAPLVSACPVCIDSVAPKYCQIETAGVVNGSLCTDCAAVLNGVFILEFSPPGAATSCGWSSPVITVNCPALGFTQVIWTFSITKSGSNTILQLVLRHVGSGATLAVYQLTVPVTPVDCLIASYLDLPLDVAASSVTTGCNFVATPSTAKIKAVL